MRGVRLPLAAFLAPLALVAPASAGNVLVVDANGTGFTAIQHAIDAAQDGDTILVRSGTYPEFWIVNRKLAVVEDIGQTVTIDGYAEVRYLAQGSDVLLSGLTIVGGAGVQNWTGVGLRLKNNVGAVRVQGCLLVGISTPQGPRSGVTVENCTNVAFTGCTIQGGESLALSETGPPGLFSSGSAIALYDCQIRGGMGFHDPNIPFGGCTCSEGGPGCSTDSFAFASGTTFTGGEGGGMWTMMGCTCEWSLSCAGGTGLEIQPGGDVHLLASPCEGGEGGLEDCCSFSCGPPGPPGNPILPPGGHDAMAGSRRKLTLPAVVQAAPAVFVTVVGAPGDLAWVHLARGTEFAFEASLSGVQLTPIEPYARKIRLGTIPASGTLFSSIEIPTARPRTPSSEIGYPESPANRSTVYHLQLLVRQAGGQEFLGSARSLVVLD